MIVCTQDVDEDIALEACEFWLALIPNPDLHDKALLLPVLPKLITVLLNGMKYTEAEVGAGSDVIVNVIEKG